ncbi:MAG: aspartate 1-decarboxylase [Bacteroidales bacterium]|jgi:aspartate 1-decarboxylase
MHITLLKSKLHKGTVTEANISYRGSITIDKKLMEESGILPFELVQVVNVNNGERFETYVIEGEKNSGVICLNGAAARLVVPGDKVIIMAYAQMELEEAINFKPTILILDENNKISERC